MENPFRRRDTPRQAEPAPAHATGRLLSVRDLSVRFGGVAALSDVELTVGAGEVCGLIGPNGAGKTTLFNCVSGLVRPTGGSIGFAGRELVGLPAHRIARLGVARTFQNLGLLPTLSARENVKLGAHPQLRHGMLSGALQSARGAQERQLDARADALLERVGLGAVAERVVSELPFGSGKRVELARALMGRPALLLLDEPANGLSHGEVDELAGLLLTLRREYALTVLLVEHHMGMVQRVADRTVVLDFGRVIAQGIPGEVARDPAVVEAYLGAAS